MIFLVVNFFYYLCKLLHKGNLYAGVVSNMFN